MEYDQVLKDLKRQTISTRNRIQSIIFDSRYVEQFSQYPLVANERCGLWYIEPDRCSDSVYFKSTDGHTGEWKFSLRRLNFHLLSKFQSAPVVVLVDSTRKGKLMPDALSKTVPIWCAVLNYIMFEGDDTSAWGNLGADNWLNTPPEMVSASEHSSIASLIPQHAKEVLKLNLISKHELVSRLGAKKPVIPQWLYPSKVSQEITSSSDYFSICCLTASVNSSSQGDVPGWTYDLPYVQGAADDHELWASKDICSGGLDHKMLWNNVYYEPDDELRVIDMATGDIYPWLSERDFLARINKISTKASLHEEPQLDISRLSDTNIIIGAVSGNLSFKTIARIDTNLTRIIILSERYSVSGAPEKSSVTVEHYKLDSSKKGAKKLREVLPHIVVNGPERGTTVVLCDTGKDLCVAVALCILCTSYDTSWARAEQSAHINKDVIKQHLSRISDIRQVNPSRNTLQSVNTFLMSRNWAH